MTKITIQNEFSNENELKHDVLMQHDKYILQRIYHDVSWAEYSYQNVEEIFKDIRDHFTDEKAFYRLFCFWAKELENFSDFPFYGRDRYGNRSRFNYSSPDQKNEVQEIILAEFTALIGFLGHNIFRIQLVKTVDDIKWILMKWLRNKATKKIYKYLGFRYVGKTSDSGTKGKRLIVTCMDPEKLGRVLDKIRNSADPAVLVENLILNKEFEEKVNTFLKDRDRIDCAVFKLSLLKLETFENKEYPDIRDKHITSVVKCCERTIKSRKSRLIKEFRQFYLQQEAKNPLVAGEKACGW